MRGLENEERRVAGAQPDHEQGTGHEDDSGEPERRLQVALDEAHDDGEGEVEDRRQGHRSARVEGEGQPFELLGPSPTKRGGGDVGEGEDDVEKSQPDEGHHGEPGALA